MAHILDLPTELLVFILEEVGGRELRRNTSKLAVCRRWYEAARPVYLSGLEESRMRIHGCDIGDSSSKLRNAKTRSLMHKNTQELYIRLLSHWWDQNSKRAFTGPGLADFEEDSGSVGNEPPREHVTMRISQPLPAQPDELPSARWQRQVLDPAVKEVAADLHHFIALESFRFELLFEYEVRRGPQLDYIKSSTVATLISNLPLMHNLSRLTLDLGVGLNYAEENAAHLCEDVAKVIPRVEYVRLRLKLICSEIFHLPPGLRREDIQLKSLIVKMHLPMREFVNNLWSRPCSRTTGSRPLHLTHEDIIEAGQAYLSALTSARGENGENSATHQHPPQPDVLLGHGMTRFRISRMDSNTAVVTAIDVLNMHLLYVPYEFFAYEDNMWPWWFEDEDELLADGGEFTFASAV